MRVAAAEAREDKEDLESRMKRIRVAVTMLRAVVNEDRLKQMRLAVSASRVAEKEELQQIQYEAEQGMTAEMIVPTSIHDSAARNVKENSESSEFQQFEFWVNGVKRSITIPLNSEVEPTSEASSKVINVDPGDIDEVHSYTCAADPIVIDPDLNDDDDGASCIPLSHEELALTSTVALGAVGHSETDQSTVPQYCQSNARQNDQISIDTASSSPANGNGICGRRRSLTIRSELEKRRVLNLPKSDVSTCVNQIIASQLTRRTDSPVVHSYAPNSQPRLRGLLVPSNMSRSVGKVYNAKMPVIPSELVKSSNSSTPLNLSDAGYKALLQTVNSGIPVIMANSTIQPLGRDGSPVLPSSTLNGSVTYVLRPQWQPNTTTSVNRLSSDGSVQLGLTKQTANQSSLMLTNKRSHYSVPTQTSCVQLRVADSLVDSSGTNQSVNLSQFVTLNGQCYDPTASSLSVPFSLDPQVRKVKITTDINGSCIISVDGLSSNADKATNSNTSNILTTGGVPCSAVPCVMPDIFQRIHPSAIQSCQPLRLLPSVRGTLQSTPSNALGNHRPIGLESLNILQNDKVFCLKQPNCLASSMPPLSFASQNVGLLGFQPSCTMQTGLATQIRANGTQLVSGALHAAGSVRASSTASLPVGMLSLCRLPSSMSMNAIGPPQPSVKCSSVACSASSSVNSSALPNKLASSHISSVSSELQSSVSLAPACLPRAIPLSGFHMHRNAVSIPSVKSTNDATGSSYNKLNSQSIQFDNPIQVLRIPYHPPVTVYSSFLKSGCSVSAVPEMSQNLVMSPVTRIFVNEDQVTNPMGIVNKSLPTGMSGATAGITTPSASSMKSVSSSLVSSASAWETPTFPQWSRPAVNISRDSVVPCKASMLSSNPVIAVASCQLYPPTIYSQTSSTIADRSSNSIMAQHYSLVGNTVPLFLSTKVFPTLAPTVSCCPTDTSSRLAFSIAQRPNQSSSTSQVTKSAFSFYNSHLRDPGGKSIQKPIPLSKNLSSNTSINSVESVCSASSQNISNGKIDAASSLIPISVQYYESGNVTKKRKHKSSNSRRRNGSCNTSMSSISDAINLLSDPESIISSSESWASDDSITIGKRRTRRRCRKLTKRNACGSDKYSHRSLEISEANYKNLDLQCFVSLENLYLNGRTWVDIHDSSENLVCCRYPTLRHTSTVKSLRENVSRKKSYKLLTAFNYLSETD